MQSILPLATDAKASKTGKANISRDKIMHGMSYRVQFQEAFGCFQTRSVQIKPRIEICFDFHRC